MESELRMAEQIEEIALEAPAEKKKGKLMLYLVAIIPIVTLVAFLLVTKVVNPRLASPDDAGKALAAEEEKVEEEPVERYAYDLGTVLVNPAGSSKLRIMKVGVSLELISKSLIEEVDGSKQRLRHQLIMVLSSKDLELVCSPEGKGVLQEEVKEVFISELKLGPSELIGVYFTEFVVQ